ncbi:MAG: hypothetical protein ACRC8S_00400 [Fimbriiglobus sp.]
MDDIFASCTEATALTKIRDGVFEWEHQAELAGVPVALMLSWHPSFDGPLAPIVAAARTSWQRLQSAEPSHRQALLAEVVQQYRWVRVPLEEVTPIGVSFLPDGSAEIAYCAFVDGEHSVVAEVSSVGEYVSWRAE